jgi:hypothetical protein
MHILKGIPKLLDTVQTLAVILMVIDLNENKKKFYFASRVDKWTLANAPYHKHLR